MRISRILPITVALVALVGLMIRLAPGDRTSAERSREEADNATAPSADVSRVDTDEAPPPKDTAAMIVEAASDSESRLERGPNRQMILNPDERVTTAPRTDDFFAEPFFRVRSREVSGPLTVNEHTLSAVEAEYDPAIVDRFLESGAGALEVPVAEDRRLRIEVDRIVQRTAVTHSLVGKVAGESRSDVTLVFHDGAVSGSVALFDTNDHYELAMAGNGDVAIRKLDPSTYTAVCERPGEAESRVEPPGAEGLEPAEGGNPADAPEEESPSPTAESAESEPTDGSFDALYTMDTVIGYGQDARADEGGTAAIEAKIIAAVDRTNTAFLNSDISDTELVLLGTIEDPEYESPGRSSGTMSSTDELGDLSDPSDGSLDAITGLRDLLGADHSGFVVTGVQGAAGVAWRPGRSMLVARTYMSSTRLTFVHEFGHNLNCRHAWGDSGDNNSVSNFGWRFEPSNAGKTRTVMAYDWDWARIPYFSNPGVLYDGEPTGAVDGFNASGEATIDSRLVSGGLRGSFGAGYDGSNPDLGARNADAVVGQRQTMMNRATRNTPVSGPETSIEQPNTNELTDGSSTTDFGISATGLLSRRTFMIQNKGDADLTGIALSINGSHSSDFRVVSPPPDTLGSLELAFFTIEFSPTAVGSKTASLHVTSNDADESPFDILLTGESVTPLTEFFDDFDPGYDTSLWSELGASVAANTNGQAAGAGSTDNSLWFGGDGDRSATTMPVDVNGGGNVVFRFAAGDDSAPTWEEPESGDELVLEYSTDGSTFAQIGGPYDNKSWQEFTVAIPAAAQTTTTVFRFRQLNHSGNTWDHCAIEDVLIETADPEITLEQPAGNDLTDGSATIDFGLVATGSSQTLELTVRNVGSGELTGLGIMIDGSEMQDFQVTDGPAAPVAGGESTTFTVEFTPSAPGARNATLHLASNDADENPFDLALTGTGTAPEISVLLGGAELSNGDETAFEDVVGSGGSTSRTFTVRNVGQAPMTGLGVNIGGAGASDYSTGTLPTELAPGASADLTVTFSPPEVGESNASLRISSNDADENPFDVGLKGTRVERTTLRGWAESFGLSGDELLPGADGDGDLITLLEEYAWGMDPTVSDRAVLIPGPGTSGLPSIRLVGSGDDRRLVIEFVRRRTDPDLTYVPEFGAEPSEGTAGGFESATEPETVSDIDLRFRRVVVEDSGTTGSSPARFGRVRMEYSGANP